MFISKKQYNRLVEERDKWRDLAIRTRKENKDLLELVRQTNETNSKLTIIRIELMKKLEAAEVNTARRIFADVDSLVKSICKTGYCGPVSGIFSGLKKVYKVGVIDNDNK